jgi:hypothetical protein
MGEVAAAFFLILTLALALALLKALPGAERR